MNYDKPRATHRVPAEHSGQLTNKWQSSDIEKQIFHKTLRVNKLLIGQKTASGTAENTMFCVLNEQTHVHMMFSLLYIIQTQVKRKRR